MSNKILRIWYDIFLIIFQKKKSIHRKYTALKIMIKLVTYLPSYENISIIYIFFKLKRSDLPEKIPPSIFFHFIT